MATDSDTWLRSLSKPSGVPDRANNTARRPMQSVSSSMASDIDKSISERRNAERTFNANGGTFAPTQGYKGRTGTDYRI